jgi:hypothetical protein
MEDRQQQQGRLKQCQDQLILDGSKGGSNSNGSY